MREPIKPEDIRVGDLVRLECSEPVMGGVTAYEYVAVSDGQAGGAILDGEVFLLDRPTPAVDLPVMPTLGWLRTKGHESRLAHWFTLGHGPRRLMKADRPLADRLADDTLGWAEAVAVPREALDDLRHGADCSGPTSCAVGHMRTFLAAVDAANGDPR